MVLIRARCVLPAVLAALAVLAGGAGCGQSLFDANGERRDGGTGGDDGGDGGPPVPKTCPATCLADAAADFDKPANRVRYVEEGSTTYFWPMMTPMGNERIGVADPENKIKRCADDQAAPACQGLSNALLVTPAGGTAVFYPAIEFRSASAQVLHLIVRARVPSGSKQNIRLHRNSREDVLVSALGVENDTVEQEIIVDALPSDRFLVAVEPAGSVGGSAAIEFFVSSMDERFPVTCQLAASFSEVAPGNMLEDLCTNRELASLMDMGTPVAPTLVAGPFADHGNAIDLAPGRFLQAPVAAPLARPGNPLTIQLWAYVESVTSAAPGVLFDDGDPDQGGGLDMSVYQSATPLLEVNAYSNPASPMPVSTSGPFTLGKWHFVRVVDADGKVTVCVDGQRLGSFAVSGSRPATSNPVHLGKSVVLTNAAVFDGVIDDVRVFSTALPCL